MHLNKARRHLNVTAQDKTNLDTFQLLTVSPGTFQQGITAKYDTIKTISCIDSSYCLRFATPVICSSRIME